MRALHRIARTTTLLAFAATLAAQSDTSVERVDVAGLGPDHLAVYAAHLAASGAKPVDYLVGKCQQYDVVLVGETHAVQENCRFVAGAIAPLYHRAGVRQLATEFVRTRNTPQTNRLVTAPEFDDELALMIMRDGPWPTWGYREYVDILRSVWRLNASLPDDAEKLRVAGMDSDWQQYDLWFEVDRRENFDIRLARERNMVRVVEEQAFAAKRKTVVHVGFSHSITCHGVRLGTVLFEKYGDRLFQVGLHHRVTSGRNTAKLTVWLESVFAARDHQPVGFDVLGSPFANVHDDAAMWARARPEYRFSDMAQGYVFLAPLDQLHRVTWIPGFITPAMFERARAVAEKAGYVEQGACADAESLDRALARRFDGSADKKL